MNRSIFQYHDGQRDVYADPVTIHRRLTRALGGSPNDLLQAIRSDSVEVAGEATEKLVAAVRSVFSMPALDPATGLGATEDDCMAALNAFVTWMEKKKSTTRLLSDLVAAYGFPPGLKINYGTLVGLWLNTERVRWRTAAAVLDGHGAMYQTDLPRAYYDAVCLLEEEVDEAEFAGNFERQRTAVRARRS